MGFDCWLMTSMAFGLGFAAGVFAAIIVIVSALRNVGPKF